MSEQYVGEIRILPYMRGAPQGWFLCNGALQPISQYEVLYSLIGTAYGGDGQSTFGLPDLRGRVPVHQGQGTGLSPYTLGQIGGTESITLTTDNMGPHSHVPVASGIAGTSADPTNNVTAAITGDTFYDPNPLPSDAAAFPASCMGLTGGSQPHNNCAPTLTLQYCIAWAGIFPSRN
jgi:microcystin-dependent protein